MTQVLLLKMKIIVNMIRSLFNILVKKRYNKVKEGDLFVYRKPKASEGNNFYFFGVGKVGKIKLVEELNDGHSVICKIEELLDLRI